MQPTPPQSSHTAAHDPAAPHADPLSNLPARAAADGQVTKSVLLTAEDDHVSPGADDPGGNLADIARSERDDMRPRLREELGREPSEEELDEWLRQHTEGY